MRNKPSKRIAISKPRILTTAELKQVKGNGIGTSPSVVEPIANPTEPVR